MDTSKTKNIFFIVLVAILSSVVTLLGYNVITKDDGNVASRGLLTLWCTL